MTWHILIIQWDAFWQLQEIIGVTLLLNYVFYVCVWCRVEGNSVFLEILRKQDYLLRRSLSLLISMTITQQKEF